MGTSNLTNETTNHLRLLTEQEAGELLGWSIKTLQMRRWKSQPPTFIKIGRSVRYAISDIQDFIESSVVRPQA